MVYAIVKASGRQEKVSVGDVLFVNKLQGEVGSTVELTPVMVVDGTKVTTADNKLKKVSVSAEILGPGKGPKIVIQKYKNKTGYKKRQGHRQALTRIKITGIE